MSKTNTKKTKQTKFHVDLIKSIDNFLEVCKDLRQEKNEKKKKTLENKFDKIHSQVWKNFDKYDSDKIKFTYIDDEGNLKNAY